MKWLITGGCGFIGTSLIRHLREEGGHAIRIIDNLSAGRVTDVENVVPCEVVDSLPKVFHKIGAPVKIIVGDIANLREMTEAAKDAEIIVHLAANTGVIPSIEDPISDCQTNVVGTVHALEAARIQGVKRFVLASSGAPIGEQDPPIHEQMVAKPLSPYGASKLAGEAYCSVYNACFGIKTTALRFGNVYGPNSGLKGSVVAKFIKQALKGQTLIIYGDGAQTRDFIFVSDLVKAIRLASKSNVGGEIFQIATSRETTVNEIAETISELLKEMAGVDVRLRHKNPRVGEVLRNYSDISKAKKILGWSPSYELKDGLRETVQWFLGQRKQRSEKKENVS